MSKVQNIFNELLTFFLIRFDKNFERLHSEQEAVKMMADTDKRRMTNYNFYTEQKWGKASNYTLCLNSSQLGYASCEKLIMECSE